ncbi:MAG TPA: type II toxin-antitoxin system PemK/MazF family toxin [Candidatus Saccharimonadales bacterium]|nr:type II toxin-antitoxin system PemK/MazF family toxin [Candidatus Saccharimonadales bacterium]
MSGPKLFGIYTAQFPFLDAQEVKIRPVIVVGKPWGQHKVLAVVPISSKSELEDVDVALPNWSDEGLLKPSVARVHRLTTMLQSDLIAELGELTRDDKQNLQSALRQLFDL